MSRPAVEVAHLLHKQGDRFIEQSPWLNFQQLSVLRAIARCRTAALGGHIDQCSQCGHPAISYNSCLMGSLFQWGVESVRARSTGFFEKISGTSLTIIWGPCYVDAGQGMAMRNTDRPC